MKVVLTENLNETECDHFSAFRFHSKRFKSDLNVSF